MESYLSEQTKSPKAAGAFLEQFLDIIDIKKKDFAEYIDYEPSNLTAILKGRRKINSEMAIKLGQIFKMNPAIWLHIESKNELLQELASEKIDYNRYSLIELMKRAG
jgi:addiction module HigA family antidote